MVNSNEVQLFINGLSYENALSELEGKYKIATNKEEFPSVLLEYDVNKIKASGASLSNLTGILTQHLDSFLKYIDLKLKFTLNESTQQEGNDEEDVIVKRLAPYKNFLVTHLLEYYLIANNVGELHNYLKKIRIPNSKKYCEQLKNIYNSI